MTLTLRQTLRCIWEVSHGQHERIRTPEKLGRNCRARSGSRREHTNASLLRKLWADRARACIRSGSRFIGARVTKSKHTSVLCRGTSAIRASFRTTIQQSAKGQPNSSCKRSNLPRNDNMNEHSEGAIKVIHMWTHYEGL